MALRADSGTAQPGPAHGFSGHRARQMGRTLLDLQSNSSNSSFPERCGGKVCSELTPGEKQAFCKSDPYPKDDELENFQEKISVGTLYEFYCDKYNYPQVMTFLLDVACCHVTLQLFWLSRR